MKKSSNLASILLCLFFALWGIEGMVTARMGLNGYVAFDAEARLAGALMFGGAAAGMIALRKKKIQQVKAPRRPDRTKSRSSH
jgi:hypothetical protein